MAPIWNLSAIASSKEVADLFLDVLLNLFGVVPIGLFHIGLVDINLDIRESRVVLACQLADDDHRTDDEVIHVVLEKERCRKVQFKSLQLALFVDVSTVSVPEGNALDGTLHSVLKIGECRVFQNLGGEIWIDH